MRESGDAVTVSGDVVVSGDAVSDDEKQASGAAARANGVESIVAEKASDD